MERFNVFISQPMRGKTNNQIQSERDVIIEKAKSKCPTDIEFYVIDSFRPDEFEDENSVKNKPLFYLAKSIECLAQADIAIFGYGWENARGCKIEHECAQEYGIPIVCL